MPRVPAGERRQEFVNAAVEVIAAHGIDGATTRRIAEQARAPLATLHYCYDSKEDLFADVFDFVAARFQSVLADSDPHAGLAVTARELLRGVIGCYFESHSFAATTLELFSWAQRQPENRGTGVYERAFDTMRTILRNADQEKQLTAEAIDDIIDVIAALADGFAINWLTRGGQTLADEQLNLVTSVLDSWLAARIGQAAAKRPRSRSRVKAASNRST
ncbi:TetR/AcrR family transcriptional regulator [Amycolatopsis australiensis]|uniref:DNA-binding transcriptional regulator, AcrR family n=1 Tax=Amycolatopsis australiensis TaxID=546364 RepID=A0A1K1SPV3_9PSEU|nr:TetR/AcrR family transcriptional regulator [Amycolatopsis australiensis]SFW86347.1 DNA-binding transcriptional regulator, AcrR family [Amycolatopsis australiensis]